MISTLIQPQTPVILLGIFLAYIFGVCIHRLFFSPLSKFPGPKFAAVTRIPFVWHIYQGNAVHWIRSLHEQYGEVVRTAPQELSFSTGAAFKDVHAYASTGRRAPQKDLRFYGPTSFGTVPDIIRANDGNHSRFRRNFSHAFSHQAITEQEPLILKYVDLLIDQLDFIIETRPGNTIDMVKMFNLTTFDIMADLTFGESQRLLQDSKYNGWVTIVYDSIKIISILQIFRYLPWLGSFKNLVVEKSMAKKRQDHFQNCRDLVDRRLASETPRPDIWGLVLKASDEKRLSVDEMYANSHTFMVAGTETTATLLSGLTYHLVMNPGRLEKLIQEIRTNFSSSAQITLARLQKLDLLTAYLHEALRMYPPVPIGLPRIIEPEGKLICGEMIPGNTAVSVSHWATYRNPNNFKDPNSFRPERWMGDPNYDSDKKEYLQPFSTGPRNCIGKNLAYHEMRLIMAKLLWNFELSPCEECANWADQKVFLTLWEKPALWVKVTPRIRI